MKSAIAVCLVALCAAALARPHDDDHKTHYTDKWDDVNIPEVLANEKLFGGYYNCIMDLGRCTPDGKELKSNIHDGLSTHCAKCTKAQRDGVELVIGHLVNNMPEEWKKLKAKYDPSGKFSSEYEADLTQLKKKKA